MAVEAAFMHASSICLDFQVNAEIFLVCPMQNRSSGGITIQKAQYAKEFEDLQSLEEICEKLKPTAAIGAAAISGAFTEKFIKMMGENNKTPIIFALSNPTSKAECTAEQAYKLTEVQRSDCDKCWGKDGLLKNSYRVVDI